MSSHVNKNEAEALHVMLFICLFVCTLNSEKGKIIYARKGLVLKTVSHNCTGL